MTLKGGVGFLTADFPGQTDAVPNVRMLVAKTCRQALTLGV